MNKESFPNDPKSVVKILGFIFSVFVLCCHFLVSVVAFLSSVRE